MATTLSEVDNTCAHGPVTGPHAQFPWILSTGDGPREPPVPGGLVTSYYGQRHLDATGRLGLGIIVGVYPHPRPLGDTQYRCIVVWNFDPDVYKDAPGRGGPPDWYVSEQAKE